MSNIDRSPCAEELVNREFSDKFESKSAGVGPLAEKEVNSTMIDWADIIVCMEHLHKQMLFEKFPKAIQKDVQVWNIGNNYLRYDGGLKGEIKERMKEMMG